MTENTSTASVPTGAVPTGSAAAARASETEPVHDRSPGALRPRKVAPIAARLEERALG